MKKITIINEKGLFGEVRSCLLATDTGVQIIEDYGVALEEGKEKQQVAKLVQVLKTFPSFEQTIYLDQEGQAKQDFKQVTLLPGGYAGSVRAQAKGPSWLQVGSFVSKSSTTEWPCEDKGWEALKDLMPLLPLFLELTEKLNIWREGYHLTYQLSRVKSIAKNYPKWQTREESLEDTVRSTSYAIYSNNAKGFLNDKGYYTPLAGCRLFESAEAARRTTMSRGLSDVVVVDVEISAQGVNPIIPMRSGFDDLMGALALAERNRLRESLDKAQMEELLAQIEKLKEKLGEDLQPQPSSSKAGRRI